MGQLQIWVWIPPLSPLLLFNFFRENIFQLFQRKCLSKNSSAFSLSLPICRKNWKDSQLIASLRKKYFFWSFIGQDFICRWEKFHLFLSRYSCFLHKYPKFWTTNVQKLFFWLNVCIFAPAQTKKVVFGREMSKI